MSRALASASYIYMLSKCKVPSHLLFNCRYWLFQILKKKENQERQWWNQRAKLPLLHHVFLSWACYVAALVATKRRIIMKAYLTITTRKHVQKSKKSWDLHFHQCLYLILLLPQHCLGLCFTTAKFRFSISTYFHLSLTFSVMAFFSNLKDFVWKLLLNYSMLM